MIKAKKWLSRELWGASPKAASLRRRLRKMRLLKQAKTMKFSLL